MVTGVIGGLGEYVGVDPNVLRLIFVLFVLLTGVFPGVVIYVIGALIIPQEDRVPSVIDIS